MGLQTREDKVLVVQAGWPAKRVVSARLMLACWTVEMPVEEGRAAVRRPRSRKHRMDTGTTTVTELTLSYLISLYL